MQTEAATTEDSLLRGRVKLFQPARGFRSSLDPVLLAGFLAPPYGRFLDVGCGTGALSFLLLARDPAANGVGVEVQPPLAGLTARGVTANAFEARYSVREGDARSLSFQPRSFDLVATNPPFQPLGQGHLPPDEQKRIAHHEVRLTLPDWVGLAARVMAEDGRLAAVFPAPRLHELLAALVDRELAPTRLRPVYPRAGEPATRVLVEARRPSGRPLVVEPPVIVHQDGRYTPEVQRWLGEETSEDQGGV